MPHTLQFEWMPVLLGHMYPLCCMTQLQALGQGSFSYQTSMFNFCGSRSLLSFAFWCILSVKGFISFGDHFMFLSEIFSFHLNCWLNNWNCSFQLLIKQTLVLTWGKGRLCFWKVRRWRLLEKTWWWRDLYKKRSICLWTCIYLYILTYTHGHIYACVSIFWYAYICI